MKRLYLALPAIFLASLFSAFASAQPPQALFYMTSDPSSVNSFLAHASQIDLLVPAWYSVASDGLVSGGANSTVMQAARAYHVPVMALVANTGYGQAEFHKLLANEEARRQMISQLIDLCKRNGYIGVQFDFENVNWTDRDGLSATVAESAAALHAARLKLSVATVPNAPGYAGQTGFAAWLYSNWRGAYDLAALAKSVDLICLMTYDQHTRWTAPGPVAGWEWTTENLDYALKSVPKNKLSLGIPLYGYHWFAGAPRDGDKPNPSAEYIGAEDARALAKAYNGHIEWDPVDHAAWFYFYRDDMREWIFFTDEQTFRDRYDLVRKNGLEGFCSWVLGQEDPAIWSVLPKRP